MKDIGKDAKKVRETYQLICPVCGKPAIRRENSRAGTAYLHLTKRGTARCFVEPNTSSGAARHKSLKGKAKKGA